eukprot:Phypoly_transcript_15913.p1 GENE.Phypoly_transcript_15913~~Phypoly_transcript_15913.p1  ORF type:complete len:100 (+),score=14.95 Phypoly_transcript_15913:113-412(+)
MDRKEKAASSREALKKECGEAMDGLRNCKLSHPKDYAQACSQEALNIANCAAEKFCYTALQALRKSCLNRDHEACKKAKIAFDQCFIEKGFPIRPPSSF